MPPNLGSVWLRARFCEPMPHERVHVDQALQPLVTQFVGQASVLQARVSALCGQALPPKRGSVVERERLWLPVPHDLVQVVQAPNLPSKTQLTGQTCSLHARVSE